MRARSFRCICPRNEATVGRYGGSLFLVRDHDDGYCTPPPSGMLTTANSPQSCKIAVAGDSKTKRGSNLKEQCRSELLYPSSPNCKPCAVCKHTHYVRVLQGAQLILCCDHDASIIKHMSAVSTDRSTQSIPQTQQAPVIMVLCTRAMRGNTDYGFDCPPSVTAPSYSSSPNTK